MASLRKRLIDVLDSISDKDFIDLYNAIAKETNRDEFIYYMDEIDVVLDDFTPSGIIRGLADTFSLDDDYFTVDDRLSIYSFYDLLDDGCPADRDEMVDIILDSQDSFDNKDVQAVLDSAYDEEE